MERAYREAQASLDRLAELGFWFPRELAPQVVQAIVGLDGVTRMEAIATE